MNSDNSALSGITLDYGPFAFMEKFEPLYNPWVGGGLGYSFGRQPQAAATNLAVLAQVFAALVEAVGKREGLSAAQTRQHIQSLQDSVSSTYVDQFHSKHDDNCCAKLGFSTWDHVAEELWNELFRLMSSQCGPAGIDFTIFFRSLSTPPPNGELRDKASQSLHRVLAPAVLQDVESWPPEHRAAWTTWFEKYWAKIEDEGRPMADRLATMRAANPRFILRNWMAAEAYESAANGNFDVVRELHDVLSRPYDDQGSDAEVRWGGVTPQWARGRPGLAYMS